MSEHYQQGDNLWFKEPVPQNAKKTKLNDEHVVERGESTHRHRLDSDRYEYFETPEKVRYLRLLEPIRLLHEEHKTINLPPGDYRIGRVVEKEMFGDMINPVVD